MHSITLSVCIALMQIYSSLAQTITVTTPLGDITGVTRRNNNVQFNVFIGIPYAKPPTGSRRFQPSEPADSWDTTFEAFDPKPYCPQRADNDSVYRQTQSEDCLYLTVYVTGDLADPPRLPVMVFIHEGGNTEGGAAEHNAIALTTSGEPVVVVVIQYRLGFLGFATSGDERVPGNNGFKDQVLALRWVQDNIESFNGDKDRVTLFGSSAGAGSVLFHMLSPMSEGLFHRAIAQSPSIASQHYETESYSGEMRRVALGLGCHDHDIDACLQSIPFQAIVNSEYNQPTVVIDGDFITDEPLTLFEEGHFHDVELIIGFNTDDTLFENLFLLRADDRGAITDPELYRTAMGMCLSFHLGRREPTNQYEDSDEDDDSEESRDDGVAGFESTGGVGAVDNTDISPQNILLNTFIMIYGRQLRIPGVTNTEALMDMLIGKYISFADPILNTRGMLDAIRDSFFVDIGVFIANQVARNGGNVHVYVFDHRSSFLEQPEAGHVPRYAPHGGELEYVFANGLLEIGASAVTDEEKQLARSMVKAWTSFAHNGSPLFLAIDGSEIDWPAYTAVNTEFVEFDTNMGTESIQHLSTTWQPAANFWSSIETLAVREDDDDDDDSDENSSEEYESSVLKLDSFEADLAVILLAVAVLLLLLATCTLTCLLCRGSSKASSYIA